MESSRAADHHIVPKHEIRTIFNAIMANQRLEKMHFFRLAIVTSYDVISKKPVTPCCSPWSKLSIDVRQPPKKPVLG